MKILADKENYLLMQIINNNKCFDRRDNTLILSNRGIASKIKVSASSVDRLFRKLKSLDLIRKVRGTLYLPNGAINKEHIFMLSPKLIFISYTKSDRWFIGALWELQDIEKVYTWSKVCRELNCFIDALTGEVKPFNWYEIDKKSDQYTSFDRCYRKKSRCIYSNEDDQDSTQFYNYNELKANRLSVYDLDWFNTINKESYFNYPLLNSGSFNNKPVNNVYDIKLEYDPKVTECIQNLIKSGLITARR